MTSNQRPQRTLLQRFAMAAPISVSLTSEHVAWLDQQRQHGSIPRSAVVRQVIDDAIAKQRRAARRQARTAA
jgi:Arc/MetJ-type ribon-helix-helix transcriptional regulator